MKKYFSQKFLIIFFILLNISTEEDNLRWAFELFRHGARTPYSGMTPDFKDCFGHQWNGIKELTGVGLRQHFLVGYRNRIRYTKENSLINPEYDPREVLLISTDSNRTIMSANAQVQGLYIPGTGPKLSKDQADIAIPPVEKDIFDKEKEELDKENYTALPHRMNIMPVHNFFVKEHFFQLESQKNCPKASSIYEKNHKRAEVLNFLNEMKEKYGKNLTKFLKNGDDENALNNYTKAYYIFDTIITYYTEGLDEFDNIVENLNVTQEELLNDSFKFFEYDLIGNGIDNDKELCLHSMSPTFDRLLQWMNLKIEMDKTNPNYIGYDIPKFVMFSAHDSTCGAFMGFMKELFGTEIKYPNFATNIYLELIRRQNDKEDNYYVHYLINDDLIKEIEYKDFVKKIRDNQKSTEEINKFCGFNDNEEEIKKGTNHVYLIVNIMLSALSILLIISIILTIKKKKTEGSKLDVEKAEPLNQLNDE